jgi:Flp pilus assembly protein TadB
VAGRKAGDRKIPVAVITEASESLPDQLRRRQVRYAVMMGLRVVCLLAGVAVVSLHLPWTPLWLALCLVGMVALPWMAVIIANDRPPREETRFVNRFRPEMAHRQLGQGRRHGRRAH